MQAVEIDENELIASLCRDSFVEFVKEFWSCTPGAGKLVWNWHMDVFCSELQTVAERVFKGQRKKYDVVCNVSPGTSKSTIWSILFPAWIWTRMPTARILTASHTERLVLDLANKSREVMRSEKYQACYPEIQFSPSQDAKGYYANTRGGDRQTCTIAGKSPMGFHAHFICFPWETAIITEEGALPIGWIVDNKVQTRVLGFDHEENRLRWQTIRSYQKNRTAPLCRVVFQDGSFVESTCDHPFFVDGVGYTPADQLKEGSEVFCVLSMPELSKTDSTDAIALRQSQMGVLRASLPGLVHEWPKSSSVQQNQEEMQGLSEDHVGCQGKVENSAVLQLQVQSQESKGKEASQVECSDKRGMRFLRDSIGSVSEATGEVNLLFKGVCQQSPFREDAREEQSELRSWERVRSLLQRVCPGKEEDKEEGRLLLFSLQDNGKQEGVGSSSHRLEQGEQSETESGCLVQTLPRETARQDSPKASFGKKVVSHVESGLRIPQNVYNLSVEEDHNYFADGVLVHNCIDDPIDPKKVLSEIERSNASLFLTDAITFRKVDKSVTPTLLVMQRLGMGDPTEVMLAESKKEGAAKIRHVCLPAEIGTDGDNNVFPSELAKRYVNGLMDPVRLDADVLKEAKARGSLFYATQFLQRPYSRKGSMFKEEWFTKRPWIRSAPYDCKRIRFVDRAATSDGGCYTAGVLLAWDGKDFYVEHVYHGQWEPDERNRKIIAYAKMDRARYGPSNDPTLYIEAERGSTGEESFRNLARQVQGEGISIREDIPSGPKDVRAEPWADCLSAGLVVLIDDGSWDIPGFIKEHVAFKPEKTVKRLGKYKDQVDAASAAYSLLVAKKSAGVGQFRIIRIGENREKGIRFLIVSKEELARTVSEEQALLVTIRDFGNDVPSEPPQNGLNNRIDWLDLAFDDVQPSESQENWETPIRDGMTCSEVMFQREQGKRLWSFLLKKRQNNPSVIVVQDDGGEDRRGLSLTYAIADVVGRPRKMIRLEAEPDKVFEGTEKPTNKHVYDVVKLSRSMVAG